MLFGYTQERVHRDLVDDLSVSPFTMGFLPYFITWGVIASQFVRAAVQTGEIPTFVYAIFFLEFILFSLFALVQYKFVYLPFVDAPGYASIEGDFIQKQRMNNMYHVLSLISKTTLVWILYSGLRATNT